MDESRLKQELHHPLNEFRSAPFWAFNGRLEEEELRFQIREMKKEGMGGFFIHSREGLETTYLSQEWMDAVDCCVDEAKKQGLEVWIYDEDKWPSGSAGGLVSHNNPREYSAKGLTLEAISVKEACQRAEKGLLEEEKEYTDGKIIGIYTAEEENGYVKKMQRGIHQEDWANKVLVLRREISAQSEWYNGYAPSDTLNPEAVREFLTLTYEAYKERFQKEFGKSIKGFFTDEPNCCDFYSKFTEGRPWLVWTDDMLDFFQKKRGYDPRKLLPYLFYEGEKASKIRHDFWRTIAERFQEAYMKQIYDWCEGEGIEFTGHILYENDLGYQARVCGAAMPQYKYLHRPGIDLLGEQTKEYLTVKQCTSAARQYGRKHTITETYGCTGWQFGFEGQKWLGDWQFVMGIDRRCQHLAQYSITGCRKRDYPPVFSYQTTWWEYNHLLEDYFSRLSLIMSRGKVVCDVMVLHPMSSVWTKCGSKEKENLDNIEMNMGWMDDHITDLNEWGDTYNRLAKMLLGAHIEFDFGDEILLSEDGSIENDCLKMGNVLYHTVVVPGILSMFESTWKLLQDFAEAGGRLIFLRPLPVLIEGETREELKEQILALPNTDCVESFEELSELLYRTIPEQYHIRNKDGQEESEVLCRLQKTEDGYQMMLVNNNRKEEKTVTVSFPIVGKTESYDPWNDTYQEVSVGKYVDNGMEFVTHLTSAENKIYFISAKEEPLWGKTELPYEHPHYADPVFAALGPVAKVKRTMENVLTLDVCRYSLEGEDLSEMMQVWEAQKEIRNRLGMQQVYYNGAVQRYFWIDKLCEKNGTAFALEFTFDVEDAPEELCWAVIEKAKDYEVFLNGERCHLTTGYFMEHQMNRFQLPQMKPGKQILTVKGSYELATELEDIYIVGDFGVNLSRHICRETEKIRFGDWCHQGCFHYPGNLIYEFDLSGEKETNKSYLLKMGEYQGTLAVVRMNGVVAGYLMGNTIRELDITKFMDKKENHLEIEIVGSPRNMFGPFHQAYTGCSRISWADFRTEGRFFTPDYVLEPYGIMGQIFIVSK